nr:hypothetical protein [Tanacetum cinerariifolium]
MRPFSSADTYYTEYRFDLAFCTSRGKAIDQISLPPPCYGSASSRSSKPKPSQTTSFQPTTRSFQEKSMPVGTTRPESSNSDNQLCPICISNQKDMAFGCGHQTCCDCGKDLELCPMCRNRIGTRIKLY